MKLTLKKSLIGLVGFCGIAIAANTTTEVSVSAMDYRESTTLQIPMGLKVTPIFIGGYDTTTANVNGTLTKVLSKDWNDYTEFLPINGRSDSGVVVVSHEKVEFHPVLGDGGGLTAFNVAKNAQGTWTVVDHPNGKFRNIDFSNVGGTLANCGGLPTPWGNVITAEEWEQTSNKAIAVGVKDTSDYKITRFNGKDTSITIKKYLNYNWMVEADPKTGKAVRKIYGMGRFGHEGGALLNDSTVILTDDNTPGFLFKYVSNSKTSFETGRLFAFKQGATPTTAGTWVEIPQNMDSLINARTVAAKKGATMYIRLEWATKADGKIYFTETGRDNPKELNNNVTGIQAGATLAHHLFARASKVNGALPKNTAGQDSVSMNDYYGRVLVYDPATELVNVAVEGGQRADGTTFSNPDGLTSVKIGNKSYLAINEDLNGQTQNRVSAAALAAGQDVSDVWLFDVSKANAAADDLRRFLTSSYGAETTGGTFTPDGSTYFVNLQHPTATKFKLGADSVQNAFPYDHSLTVAVTGFTKQITAAFETKKLGALDVRYNIFTQKVEFSAPVTADLYDSNGRKLLAIHNQNELDFSAQKAGNYIIKATNGQVLNISIQ